MVVESGDELVRQYMARLEREAAALPADRRGDLVSGISEHLAEARAAAADDDAAAVRDALSRLGSPTELVNAELEEIGAHRLPMIVAAVPGTGRELAAVLLLTAGSVVVPLLGWLVGVVLLWTSRWWRTSEKWLGTLVWPGGSFALLLAFTLPSASCTGTQELTSSDGRVHGAVKMCEGFTVTPWLGIPVALLLFGAPIAVAIVLYQRARRRATAAVQDQATSLSPW
ncbi:MAG: hypothetical protein QOJ79_2672 [Actinomycetota bacterium]|jgi:hypothetical protein|nr:hypothetical protein [Actinomycetota bacterium]